jgi:glutaredoxin-related protein
LFYIVAMDLPCCKYENYYEKIKISFDTYNIMTSMHKD